MEYLAIIIGVIILLLGVYATIREEQEKRKRRQQERERSNNNYNQKLKDYGID